VQQFFIWLEATGLVRAVGESLPVTAWLSAIHVAGFTVVMKRMPEQSGPKTPSGRFGWRARHKSTVITATSKVLQDHLVPILLIQDLCVTLVRISVMT